MVNFVLAVTFKEVDVLKVTGITVMEVSLANFLNTQEGENQENRIGHIRGTGHPCILFETLKDRNV